jgi:hypothetical protein
MQSLFITRPKAQISRSGGGSVSGFRFKRVARAAKLDKSVRVVLTRSPVARGLQELLFSNKMGAVAAFKALFVDLVVAGFLKGGKLLRHEISFLIFEQGRMVL